MSEILVKNKDIAVPGESLAEGMDYLPGQGTYREGEKIIASMLGLVAVDGRAIKLIPLSGKYLPKTGDTIIGKVIDVLMSGWRISTDSAYSSMMNMKDATSDFIPRGADLRKFFDFGDIIVCKITNVTSQKLIDVTMRGPGLRKLKGGRLIHVNTHKVPRVIGKQGSMISMVKQSTGCTVIVGQNGTIWLNCEDPAMEVLAVETIKKIEAESHISGLTDRIKKFLEEKTGKKIEAKEAKVEGDKMTYNERGDGRKLDETRPIEAKVGVIKKADGSAMFKIGKTWAYAAVYGPRELYPRFMQDPKGGILRINYNMMPFSSGSDRVRPGGSRRSKEIALVTEKALHSVVDLSAYPNSVVDIFIEFPQTDAGTRCAGICAASMALADAGIIMKDMVASVAMGCIDGTVIADLDYAEEAFDGEVADIPIAILSNSQKVSLLQMDGALTREQLKEAIDTAKKVCADITVIQKKALKEKYVGEQNE